MKPDFDNPNLFSFDDSFASLYHLGTIRKRAIDEARKKFDETRVFAREHLQPLVLSTDLKVQGDRKALSDEILALAVRHRMLSKIIPSFMGGTASPSMFGTNPAIEEMASVDPSFEFGVLAGHGLGLAALMTSRNLKIVDRIASKIVSEEQVGRPFLVDCAITEPGAGTDVEEFELLPHAKLISHAKKVDGGVILNGSKCFISGGHSADIHLVIMPFDLEDPMNTQGMFLVPKDTPGFSLGRIEEKMGMKAGSASELVFNDCFIPEENVVYTGMDMPEGYGEKLLLTVLGVTRIAVGAMGTGVARGAFERALEYAKTKTWKGKTVIQHQWAQEMLTNMLMNVYKARSIYLEAGYVLFTTQMPGEVPPFINGNLFKTIYNSSIVKKIRYSKRGRDSMLKQAFEKPVDEIQRLQFYSSMAKVAGSDAGMENCHLAIEMMGEYGLRHDTGMEKLFRDIKLCQIFEGTNQLNRLNMFKHYIARNIPGLNPF